MIKKKNRVSCIIPAYNEEERIEKTLKVVKNHPLIGEVIVINDCSTDNTEKIVRKYKKIKLVKNRRNTGKTYSLLRGMSLARNENVFLLDADLVNITKKNITDIIQPILKKEADVSIALLKNPFIFRMITVDFACGQRVFNKNLFDFDEFKKLPGFGFEAFMNKKMIQNKIRLRVVKWFNVSSPHKSSKIGFIKGIIWHLSMWKEMTKAMGFSGWISQSFQLLSLKV